MKLKILIFIYTVFILISCTPVVNTGKDKLDNIKIRDIEFSPVVKKREVKKFAAPEKKIRVGLLENLGSVTFMLSGKFAVFGEKGKQIMSTRSYSDKWTVRVHDRKLLLTSKNGKLRFLLNDKAVFKSRSEDSRFSVENVDSGKGWHWQKKKTRQYRDDIEINLISSKLTVINNVTVNKYLQGVVPSEMSASAPLEALKAQAVLARTNVYSSLGSKYSDKPYQIFSDVYSQVYSGTEKESSRTNKAVNLTDGEVLVFNGEPIEAVFHAVCGGYIEASSNVWSGSYKSYLSSHSDLRRGKAPNLRNESNFRRWINSKPDSYCKIDKRFPSQFNYAKKYYRWHKKIKRKQLEYVLRKRVGKRLGYIKDIKVLKRGKSGKALSVKVVGTKGSTIINKELNIRKSLYDTPLYSANFYVERRGVNKNGIPREFVFHGAGFGHGAGMCQVGAAGMALDKKSYKEILSFYFKGTNIGKR